MNVCEQFVPSYAILLFRETSLKSDGQSPAAYPLLFMQPSSLDPKGLVILCSLRRTSRSMEHLAGSTDSQTTYIRFLLLEHDNALYWRIKEILQELLRKELAICSVCFDLGSSAREESGPLWPVADAFSLYSHGI